MAKAKKAISKDEAREIVVLAQVGNTHATIADKMGISKSAVHRVVTDYKAHGESCYDNYRDAEIVSDIDAEEIACELNGTPPVSVDGDTDIEAYNKAWDDYRKKKEKEPASVTADTSSEQNIIPDNSTDIVPENAENVKSFEGNSSHTSPQKLPDVVLDACFLKGEELRSRIAEEEQYIRTLYEQLQELEQFVKEHGGNDNEV